MSWIVAQGIAGGNGTGDVTTLFLWVYGWVGIAVVSALIGPIWHWLDPFATLHDIAARAAKVVGMSSWEPADVPYKLSLSYLARIIGIDSALTTSGAPVAVATFP